MSKTIKKCFYQKLTFSSFLDAHDRSRKGKNCKKEVLLFKLNLETNIVDLIKEIKEKRYRIGRYHEFVIHYPKERIIKAPSYKDRIVHQWYVHEFIKPYVLPRFITDSYACIENRGNHKAVLKLQKYMRIMKRKYNNYYVLKCDVKKFFYNIDKEILFEILKKDISDDDLLNFTKVLIFSEDNSKVGIPIGNYTSQFFANIYLNELDHYIKEKINVKYYIRYMDDFILLFPSKEEASYVFNLIREFLNKKLNLELNRKSRYFPNNQGIDFCGYKIYETHILVRKRCKKDMKKKIKKWNNLFYKNKLDLKKTQMSISSWKSHCKHACSYNLVNKMMDKITF